MRKIYLVVLGLMLSIGSMAQYCTVGVGPSSTADSNIESFSLNGETLNINETPACPGVAGVEDQTGQVADLIAGNSYTINVGWGSCSGFYYTGVGEIWIDYDGSQTFDSGESIGTGIANGVAVVNDVINFTVPALALNGTHRMRVMQWEGGTGPLNPCGSFTWGSVTDYSITISGGSSCGPATALNVSNNTGTTIDLNWTPNGSSVADNVEWGFPGFVPGTGAQQGAASGVVGGTTNATGLTFDTNYEFYVQTDCGGSQSGWAGPYSFFTGYCQVSTTSTFDYLSDVHSIAAVSNVNYTASSQPAGSYADETAQIIESYPGGTFDMSTTYVGGTNGINIWVDWNNDLDFTDPGENVFYLADANLTKVGTINVPGGQALGNYRMRVRGQWGTGANPPPCGSVNYGSTVDFTLMVNTPPSCPPPISLSVTNVTGSSVDLSWTETGSATQWEIEYGAPGFTPGTGTTMLTSNNPETVTGLNSTSAYDIYVRAICGVGDTSNYAGPESFTTSLAALSCGVGNPFLLYSQDFEGSFPSDWSIVTGVPDWLYNTGTTTSGSTGPSGAHSGTGYVYLETSSGATGSTDTLISPAIDLSSVVAEARMTFYYHMYGATMGSMEVLTSTNNVTWTSQWSLTGQQQTSEAEAWTPVEIDLTPYVGGLIYVRIVGTRGTSFTGDMAIDLFQVEGCVTCPGPSNFSSSNLTPSSVDLSWTETGSATNWIIEYGPSGFTPGTGTVIPTSNNPETITGLTDLTAYDFYIQADCGGGDTSGYVGPLAVMTPIASLNCSAGSPLILLSEDFEGGSIPATWINGLPTGPNWTWNSGQTTSIDTGPNAAFSGTGYVYLETSSGANQATDTLTAPMVNLASTVDQARILFRYHKFGATMDKLSIEASSDGVLWNEIWADSGETQFALTDPWIVAEADVTAYAGGNLMFRFIGKRGSSFTGDMAIDLVEVEACISCPDPSSLVASNETTTSVDLAWAVGGTETSWIIEYGPAGFTPGTGTQVTTSNNPETVSGLIDNTNYDFYVYADCGGGDKSLPIGPVNTSTLIVCAAPNAFTFTYAANDTVGLTWTPGGLESMWTVEYGPAGYTPGTGTQHTATIVPDTTFNIPTGVWEFYVQADCGSGLNNPWTGPLQYISPIPNDSTCDATPVNVDGSTNVFANINATEQVGSPVAGFNTVWFTFVAPLSGNVEISTCGADNTFNTMLEVYFTADCSNFGNYTFQGGANGNPFGACSGVATPAGLNMCGLIPGTTYYLAVGGELVGDEGIFPLTLTELPAINAGTGMNVDVCEDNAAFDLFSTISGNLTQNGQWYNPVAMTGNEVPSTINVVGVPTGTYPFVYVDQEICGTDTSFSTITIIELPNVGVGSTISAGCNFGDVNLYDGLSGNIDLGGTWYDDLGTDLGGGTADFAGEPAGTYTYYYVVDNGVCAADSATVLVDVIDCTGIGENDLEVIVYPNPVSDFVYIKLANSDAEVTVQLMDIQGQAITAQINVLSDIAKIDMSDLADGIYFIRVAANGTTKQVKVVKQ